MKLVFGVDNILSCFFNILLNCEFRILGGSKFQVTGPRCQIDFEWMFVFYFPAIEFGLLTGVITMYFIIQTKHFSEVWGKTFGEIPMH